jgi:hypothetical protein
MTLSEVGIDALLPMEQRVSSDTVSQHGVDMASPAGFEPTALAEGQPGAAPWSPENRAGLCDVEGGRRSRVPGCGVDWRTAETRAAAGPMHRPA